MPYGMPCVISCTSWMLFNSFGNIAIKNTNTKQDYSAAAREEFSNEIERLMSG